MVVGGVLVYFAFVFDCVDGQLARYTRQFSKLGAWLDSIFDRSKEYVVFAGLAIGASRTGDPVWLLAGAALALQTTRHAIDFSYPVSQHQVIAETPQPPLEDPFDVPRPASRLTEPVETEEVEEEDAEALPPVPARPTLKQRAARLWRATDRGPHALGQEDHPVPDRRALRRDRDHRRVLRRAHRLHRPARLGRLRDALRPARPHGAVAGVMSAAAIPSAAPAPVDRGSVLDAYRDDGPLATAIGRALGRRIPLPPIALLVVAGLPLLLAIVIKGDGASEGLVAGVVAWAVLLGGLASARPLTDRLRWMVPPALRAIEYAGLLWIGAVAGGDAEPAAFALLCAITYHHYENVYGFRHRGVRPPRVGDGRRPGLGRAAGARRRAARRRRAAGRVLRAGRAARGAVRDRDGRRVAALPARAGAGLRRRGG